MQIAETTIEVDKQSLEGPRYVFTVAQELSQTDRLNVPAWRTLGGVIRVNPTLEYRHGYIPRCEIVELRQQMFSEFVELVHPDRRPNKVAQYTITEPDPVTGAARSRRVGLTTNGRGEVVHDRLLRTPIYPSQQVLSVAGGNDGLIEMPCANNTEKHLAQLFLFPNWGRIREGLDQLPTKLRDLKGYFIKRRESLSHADPHFKLFSDVVAAAINSCDQFEAYALTHLSYATAQYRQYSNAGQPYQFGKFAENLFEALQQPRPDLVAQEQSATTHTLAESVQKLVEMQLAQMQQNVAQAAPLAAPQVQVPPPVAETVIETAPEPEPTPEPTATATRKPKVGDEVLHEGSQGKIIKVKPTGVVIEYLDGITVEAKAKDVQFLGE